MGRGMERIVKRRSGGERTSIGKMVDNVVMRVVRVGEKCF
jgi:hypothetical protein